LEALLPLDEEEVPGDDPPDDPPAARGAPLLAEPPGEPATPPLLSPVLVPALASEAPDPDSGASEGTGFDPHAAAGAAAIAALTTVHLK
jgi:hypothetical protein